MYILEIVVFVTLNPNLFPRLCDRVIRNRRDDSKLCVHDSKTALLRKSIFCIAPTIFNKLPKCWREYTALRLRNKLNLEKMRESLLH